MFSCSWRSAFSACWRVASSHSLAVFLLLTLLAGCGTLPRPFEGNPGATARKLAQPPETRLFVDMPDAGLLAPRQAELFTTASIRPYRSIVSPTRRSKSAASDTEPTTAIASSSVAMPWIAGVRDITANR